MVPTSLDVTQSDSIQDWALLRTTDVGGMVVNRPLDPVHFQATADKLAKEELMNQKLMLQVNRSSLDQFGGFDGVVAKLAAPLDLPKELSELIQADARNIGDQLLQLLPETDTFEVTLDLKGENVCARWHVDNYIGRAIVSYNSHGTEWTDPENVNFWELENCGNNDCILHKKDAIHQAHVGDILFMKGSQFEPGKRGLVHKSPSPRFSEDGSVIHRLMLKVDAPLVDEFNSYL